MEIIQKDKDLIIINKPSGVPSQPDSSGDPDAMSLAGETLRALGEDPTLFLVQRLDRVVGGLLVFARNKRSAAALSEIFATEAGREYVAVTDSPIAEGEYTDYLRKNATLSKAERAAKDTKGAKEAILELTPLSAALTEKGEKQLSLVRLRTGRFHQIRAQLSIHGAPISGDKKYGSRDGAPRSPALFCHKLSFSIFGREILALAKPEPTEYPWSLFSDALKRL